MKEYVKPPCRKTANTLGMRNLSEEEWNNETSTQDFISTSPSWLKDFEKSDFNQVFLYLIQVGAAGGEASVATSVNE